MRFPVWFFLLFPILEMLVLIKVGGAIGALNAVALVIAGAFIGMTVIRRQGFSTMLKARERMAHGEMPAAEMAEGFMIAIGGLFMMFPGFVSDIFGVALLVPAVRKALLRKMAASGRWQVHQASTTFEGEYRREDVNIHRGIDRTLDGEYERDDEKKF
ncbi:MAG: FxsA family protein [Endozoicomonas sp.]